MSITNVTPSPSLQLPIGNTFTLTGQGKSEILKDIYLTPTSHIIFQISLKRTSNTLPMVFEKVVAC